MSTASKDCSVRLLDEYGGSPNASTVYSLASQCTCGVVLGWTLHTSSGRTAANVGSRAFRAVPWLTEQEAGKSFEFCKEREATNTGSIRATSDDAERRKSEPESCSLNQGTALDTLTLPGGPALLNLLTANFTDFDATERAAGFLIRGHHIVTVTLIAHEQCGYYRARYPTRSAEQLFEQQVKDLSAAARTLRTGRPELQVHGYFARPRGNRVHFLSIEV